ncbi:PQ loop repeat-domain-containing protein [Chaetomium fimeti]|uniref:PQ loop repeat-domain-containing protein n=1 Tax=Chaetomium fimeti TaxID=1854472 RepID=A0AAE0HKT9_9PEZI|nr:PQ loop repeat-domain-containing protein [Chaetomium fimeti]
MAPQTDIPIAANVLGTIGTGERTGPWSNNSLREVRVNRPKCKLPPPGLKDTHFHCHYSHHPSRLWCIQLIPQIWTNWRTKKTDGLPGLMMFLWALCGLPFGVYAVTQNFNIPLQVQPHVFMALCLISWAQVLVYHRNWPAWKASLLGLVVAAVFAGLEAALILTLKPIYDEGNEVPIMVVGIIAAILLAAGLLPPYGELWKRRGRVIGINWVFLAMDWSGAFFSLMALGRLIWLASGRLVGLTEAVTQNTFDVLGGVLYIVW